MLVAVGGPITRQRCACASPARRRWTNCTAIAPSPTAVAHRFVDPERTSPAAKIPGTLVSSRSRCPRAEPVRMNPSSSRATASSSHSVHGSAPRKRKRNENGQPLAALQRDRLELAVLAVQLGDLAAVANRDAGALELANEVVGHRLAQVGAAVEQRHERAAARRARPRPDPPSCRPRRRRRARRRRGGASGGPAA